MENKNLNKFMNKQVPTRRKKRKKKKQNCIIIKEISSFKRNEQQLSRKSIKINKNCMIH